MSRQSIALMTALLTFALFVALGLWAVDSGEPARLIPIEHALVGRFVSIAWLATNLGYPKVLVPICLGLLIIAWRAPAWRARIFFSIAMLLVCWLAADYAQHLFARPRRLDWIVKHETAFSYPSSHAAIATGFYFLWAAFAWLSWWRAGRLVALVLAVLALGICWSRLALGAHYVTDVAGGVLLAVACVAAGAAALPINVFAEPAGRT